MEDNVFIFSFWDYLSMDMKSNGRGVVKVFAKWSFSLNFDRVIMRSLEYMASNIFPYIFMTPLQVIEERVQ